MENYEDYLSTKETTNIKLKDGIDPHKFACQPGRQHKGKRTTKTAGKASKRTRQQMEEPIPEGIFQERTISIN